MKIISKSKKGQAALEFLTTYGWAFLVILVAIGGLSYFGVFDIGRILPDGCRLDTNLECGDIFVLSAPAAGGPGQFQVELKNNRDRTVTVIGISMIERGLQSAAQNQPECTMVVNQAVNPDQFFAFDFNDLDDGTGASAGCGIENNVGEKKTFEFAVTYNVQGSGIDLVANGEVTTTVQST